MDRNREVRRGSMAAANGLSRRRHRNSSLRDSPEEDGQMELQDSARLRDRGNKKDRDRDRDRSSRNKRRRGDRLMHGSNREEGGEDSTEESIDEEEEDEDEDSGALRMLTPNPPSSSLSNHHHQRKSFPPGKFVRAAPTWKGADEMIGVSVPRKARSASAKRSHECWMSGSLASGGGAEQIHRQASTSPARLNATAPSPAPISPSSSNVSVRKKMKPIGHKQRPPKMAKPSSSSQEDIEIEVAEVLYGLMRQSQCPPKQEILSNASQKFDSKDTNGSSNEVRSRVSSPVSISPPAAAHQPSVLPQNSCTSTTTLPVVAPKRKRPRPVKPEEESPTSVAGRNGSISAAAAKVENEQPAKSEASSPKSEMNSGSAGQNAGASVDLASQPAGAISSLEPPQLEPVKAESNTASDPKPFTEESETREGVQTREEVPSSKKESPPCTKLDGDLEDATATKTVSTVSEVEYKREEKFKIDLMAPPLKSSPERDGDMEYISDPKSMALDVEMVPKAETLVTAEEMTEEIAKQDAVEGRFEEKNKEQLVEESESEKPLANTERILDLQLDLEKPDKDNGTVSVSGSKQQPQLSQVQKQQQQQLKATTRNDPKIEKAAQSTSLPLPMTLAGWPGGLPSLGYMPPLQAVVSMDGSTGSSTAVQLPHFPLSQPRPKRCATHYYIARNIFYHQQFTRINPFWPAPAGSASMYGAKPYNLNVVPPTEGTILGNPLQGNFAGRSLNSVQEKVQASGTISGHNTKDKSSVPVAANFMDATQRKQLVLQQAPQPAGAGNLLHGPAFIFPMSQQQQQQQAAAAAAAASRSGAVKSGVATGNAALPSGANSGPVAPAGSSSTAAGTATTVSFNYPNLPANEAQYLAILPNNGFPIPIPAHVGTAPPYRGGSPAQAMPFFNGFYSSQMIHPSQLQQQAQQQQAHSHPQPVQQGHQNTSTSSGSSSSQKHQQAQQQQRLQGGGSNAGGGNSKNFPASKNRLPMQQQQNHAVPASNQARQHEVEVGGEDSPSTADSRGSHARKSIYGQNFAVPVHPQNYTLMSPAALGSGGSGNHNEKQQSGKGGVELFPSQPFAVSFASFNGAATAAPGLNFSSLAQNHAIFQTLPDVARQGYQIAAAAAATQVAQQKKNQHISEEGKTGGDSINVEDERRGTAGKALAGVGQSLAFSRPDSSDPSVSTVLGNVIDGSARSLSLISAPINGNRAARPTSSTSTTPTSAPASSPSTQQQQQQQLIQLQKQQQMQQQQHQQQQMQQQLAAVVARSKTTSSSNVNVYSDRNLSTSSMATKFPSSLSVFPQALIQSSSPVQSPQWKNSSRTMGSQVPSPSLASTSTSSLKNLPQQQSRTQQGSQTHISFGVNPKAATAPQGQQIPMCHNQSPSPPVVMGSPPSSSISSKGAGGSPRTSSTGGGKAGSSPALPSQQPKNSPSGPSRKSSPVGGRNVPSILSNSHMGPALSSGGKSQSQSQVQVQQQQQQQQQQQHQLQKQTLQQPQIFFTNTYMQGPSPQSTNTTNTISSNSATTGYYHQRRQSDPHQGASTTSSGMLSLCPPLTLAGASTSDPAKAVAAAAAAAAVAANSMKGGMPPGLLHAAQFAAQTAAANSHQLMSAAFPYLHTGPAISVKPAEQKQPAGNDNLHACWQPEKEMKR